VTQRKREKRERREGKRVGGRDSWREGERTPVSLKR
jgi:hypothetical protein